MKNKLKNKSQIKLFESIMVFIVFIIIFVIAFIFFVNYNIHNLKDDQRENNRIKALRILNNVIFFPEITNTKNNIITNSIDYYLVIPFHQLNCGNSNSLKTCIPTQFSNDYFDFFKNSKIFINSSEVKWKVNQNKFNEVVLYDKQPVSWTSKDTFNFPVIIYNSKEKRNYLVNIFVEIYN